MLAILDFDDGMACHHLALAVADLVYASVDLDGCQEEVIEMIKDHWRKYATGIAKLIEENDGFSTQPGYLGRYDFPHL